MSFQQPLYLWLLATLPVLGFLHHRAVIKRRQAREYFGNHESSDHRTYRHAGLWFLAVFLLIIATAGPRWGQGGETGVIVGRDVMIILDLSRSMDAADMADAANRQRWQAAQASIREMVTSSRRRGGHRFGLVVFAAKPALVCPLTSDDAHFLSRLEEFSPKSPPPECRPAADEAITSGTSIGAGIALGLSAIDPRFPGYRDLILFSDGDGPGVAQEVQLALNMAQEQGVPVHVVGLGDPENPTELTLGAAQEDFVGTQLREAILQEIARRTDGVYIAAKRERPNMAEWLVDVLEKRPNRTLSDDLLPQPKDRSNWFALTGLVLLVLAWGRQR